MAGHMVKKNIGDPVQVEPETDGDFGKTIDG